MAGRAKRVPDTRQLPDIFSIPKPARFSFKSHRVYREPETPGIPNILGLPEISGIPRQCKCRENDLRTFSRFCRKIDLRTFLTHLWQK